MSLRGRIALVGAVALLVAACSGGSATPSPTTAPTAPPSTPAAGWPSAEPSMAASATPIAGGLLDKVLAAGKIVMSTDPDYAPQSIHKPDGTYEGFDIDVARDRRSARCRHRVRDAGLGRAHRGRLGWPLGLQRRLDDDHLAAPEGARLHAAVLLHAGPDGGEPGRSGHHDARRPRRQDDLRRARRPPTSTGSRARLDFGTASPTTTPPAGVEGDDPDDRPALPEAWQAGRNDFEGWLSSITTVHAAIDGRAAGRQGRRPGLLRAARGRDRQERAPTRPTSSPRVTRSSRPCTPTAR